MKEKDPYICPNCGSDNVETWLYSREQDCLDCKHQFKLPEEIVQDLLD